MTEINQKIIEMIKQKKSIEEISNEVNLSYKQIYNRISSFNGKGYIVNKAYNTDGKLYYNFGEENSYNQDDYFELFNDKLEIKFLVISDLHLGNIVSDEEAINTVYDYCIKNGIHIIINCGDILDGTFSRTERFIPAEEQIEYLIKHYPFDKSIYNLYTAGDHDESLYENQNISLFTALIKRRHDICPISLNDSALKNNIIKLNNYKIMVSHKAPVYEYNNVTNIKLHLVGHNHTSKAIFEVNESNNTTPRIMVPPLARCSIDEETKIPRAIELTISLNEKFKFKHVLKKDLLILNNKAINTGETIINYGKHPMDALKFNKKNKVSYVDDTPNISYVNDTTNVSNETFEDSEKKEIGELTDVKNKKQMTFSENKKILKS